MSLERHDVWTLEEGWREGRPRLLVVDNYDSFTYNLVQMLAIHGIGLDVVRNDRFGVDDLVERLGVGDGGVTGPWQGVVLSPGPGRPEDAGVCVDLLRRRPAIPILGVCLGHQAMGTADGARVAGAPELMHGKTSQVRFGDHEMFEGLPNPSTATRYHSLCVVEATLSEEWAALAWSEDGTLMGMAHRELPWWGVQFHPESVLTDHGPTLLANFLGLAASRGGLDFTPVTPQPQLDEAARAALPG